MVKLKLPHAREWLLREHPTAVFIRDLGGIPLSELRAKPHGLNKGDDARFWHLWTISELGNKWYLPSKVLKALYRLAVEVQNRPICRDVVMRILSSILASGWSASADDIRFLMFAPTEVRDGQHRLAALAESDMGAIVSIGFDCDWQDLFAMLTKNPDKPEHVLCRLLPEGSHDLNLGALQQCISITKAWLNPTRGSQSMRKDVAPFRVVEIAKQHIEVFVKLLNVARGPWWSSTSAVQLPFFLRLVDGSLQASELNTIVHVLRDGAVPTDPRLKVFVRLRQYLQLHYVQSGDMQHRGRLREDALRKLLYMASATLTAYIKHDRNFRIPRDAEGSIEEIRSLERTYAEILSVPEAWGRKALTLTLK